MSKAVNPFAGASLATLNFPGRSQFPITPDDNNELPFVTRAIWVGSPGDLNFILVDDTTPQVWLNVQPGFYSLMVKQVMFTSTTAGNLRGVK